MKSLHSRSILSTVVTATALALASPAAAHQQRLSTLFTPLNAAAPLSQIGLDPSARANLVYNHDNDSLRVIIHGYGFELGIPHVAHIHGNLVDPTRAGSGALDSRTPTLAQDEDGDGFIELFEGLKTYGAILFDFENIDADLNGVINYDQTFDLRAPGAPFGFINPLDESQGTYGITDLVGLDYKSLDLRELVIHGLNVPTGVGIDNPNQNAPTDDEINGHSTFAPGPDGVEFGHTVVFPVASGELAASAGAVPEPASWAMLIAGFGLTGAAMRRRTRAVAA